MAFSKPAKRAWTSQAFWGGIGRKCPICSFDEIVQHGALRIDFIPPVSKLKCEVYPIEWLSVRKFTKFFLCPASGPTSRKAVPAQWLEIDEACFTVHTGMTPASCGAGPDDLPRVIRAGSFFLRAGSSRENPALRKGSALATAATRYGTDDAKPH